MVIFQEKVALDVFPIRRGRTFHSNVVLQELTKHINIIPSNNDSIGQRGKHSSLYFSDGTTYGSIYIWNPSLDLETQTLAETSDWKLKEWWPVTAWQMPPPMPRKPPPPRNKALFTLSLTKTLLRPQGLVGYLLGFWGAQTLDSHGSCSSEGALRAPASGTKHLWSKRCEHRKIRKHRIHWLLWSYTPRAKDLRGTFRVFYLAPLIWSTEICIPLLNLPISTPFGKTSSDGSPNLKIKADPWMKYLQKQWLDLHLIHCWHINFRDDSMTAAISASPLSSTSSPNFGDDPLLNTPVWSMLHIHPVSCTPCRQIMKSWLLQGWPRESFFPIFFDHFCFENRDQMHLRMAFFRIWDAPPSNSDNQDLPFLAFGNFPPKKKLQTYIFTLLLLMEEILHYLGRIKPCK